MELSEALSSDLLDALTGQAVSRLLDAQLQRLTFPQPPAAGAELVIPVPGGTVWELLALSYTFTASGAVANRRQRLIFDNGETEYVRIVSTDTVVAGQAWRMSWIADLGASISSGTTLDSANAIPNFVLNGGHRIRTATSGIDVADTITSVALLVAELSPAAVVQQVDSISRDFTAVLGL